MTGAVMWMQPSPGPRNLNVMTFSQWRHIKQRCQLRHTVSEG